jgi:hypothetical protein
VRLDAPALDRLRFSEAQCDALFAAILIDDQVDPHTELPDTIPLDYDESRLLDCFALSRQLWKVGVDRGELIEIVKTLKRDGNLGPEDRLRFKHIRAKFKHLRFAYALYDTHHRYPVMLNWITTAMGHLQDAMKNGRPGVVAREAALSRFFLMSASQYFLTRDVDHFSPSSSNGFRHYVEAQVATLRNVLDKPAVTGREFHETRKIVSRQASFYNSLLALEPSRESFIISRAMSAINGLMGRMHDELVERRIAGTQDYHRESFSLPDEIRQRLVVLVARYPQ